MIAYVFQKYPEKAQGDEGKGVHECKRLRNFWRTCKRICRALRLKIMFSILHLPSNRQ